MKKGIELLKNYRKEYGYTQEDVSKITGIPRSTIARMESQESYETSPKTAKILANLLGISWTDFFENEE